MTNEEKKAIEYLNNMIKHKPDTIRLEWRRGIYALQLILNLIAEQQKEIEELKEQDLSNSKIIANMSERHFNDSCKIKRLDQAMTFMLQDLEVEKKGYSIKEMKEAYFLRTDKNVFFIKEMKMNNLSEEEREALRNFKSEYETCNHNSSDLIIELDDAKIILNLIEKQQKEIEELKEKNNNLANIKIAEWQDALTNAISKDKLKENFAKDIAFKKRLDRQGERIDQYNKGRFDVIEEILELLEE